MPVTKHGPASSTVTRSTRPSSSKTCVIPSLRPSRPAAIPSPLAGHPGPRPDLALRRHVSDELDLDVDPRRQVVEPLQRVDRLRRRLEDVDQPLVGADLEVLAGVLVLERRPDYAIDVLLR